MLHTRRALLLVLTLVGVLLAALAAMTIAGAQKPPPPPPEAIEALMDCAPWRPDVPPDPQIVVPAEVRAIYVADEQRIGITWRDEADNETCFGVLQTASVPPALSPEGSPTLIIVALANANGASTMARPGRACFRIYAGNRSGRSALSAEACVDVPVPSIPPGVPTPAATPVAIARIPGPPTPALTPDERVDALAIAAADPALRAATAGRTVTFHAAGVWHTSAPDLAKIGAGIDIEVNPPLSGEVEWPGITWDRYDEHGQALGWPHPTVRRHLLRGVTRLHIGVDLHRRAVVRIDLLW